MVEALPFQRPRPELTFRTLSAAWGVGYGTWVNFDGFIHKTR